jgi:hypothetical protein
MKETKILKNNQVHAQSFKQTEQALANLTNANLKTLSEALADKDKIISELEYKIDSLEEVSKTSLGIINSLEKQNKDLDYLLNSGRNKFEQGRIERLKELEEALASQQEVYQASL